jgi:hypothetical protein
MSNPVLRKAVENEFKRIIESLLYQSSEDECFEDYLLDLKYYGSVKTFKEIWNAMVSCNKWAKMKAIVFSDDDEKMADFEILTKKNF